MRVTIGIGFAVAAALFFVNADFSNILRWTIEAQRAFQNQMATAVLAIRNDDPGAYFALLSAAGAYGFVHALGPGHGKYLIGGIGLGTQFPAYRLVGLAVASSLAQAFWAILLVYGGFIFLKASAGQITHLAEKFLAPVSYLAIACVGLLMVWRGVRSFPKKSNGHKHADECCSCHSHGPTPEEALNVSSMHDAFGLVLSIAVRPCTGAIFLLVIAWQMEIRIAGAMAVISMGMGTAALISAVAASSIVARHLSFKGMAAVFLGVHAALPALQVFAGTLVVVISLSFLALTA